MMKVYVILAVTVFISLYLFLEINCVKKSKRGERREQLNERRQELLENVLKKNRDKTSDSD